MKTPETRHMAIFSPKSTFYDFYKKKFIKVTPIVYENSLYFGCVNQPFVEGDLYYDVNKGRILSAKRKYDGTDRSRIVIVAFPEEIDFIINDWTPHDRNYEYRDGLRMELIHPDTIEEIKNGKKNTYLSIEPYVIEGGEEPFPITLEYFKRKVVLHIENR